MITRKGGNSGKAGSSSTGGGKSSKPAVTSSTPSDKAIDSLLTRQNDCLQKLNCTYERVERESNKLAAERKNKLIEIQLTSYKGQNDASFKFNMNALDGVTSPDAEQRLWKELENTQKQEMQAMEEADPKSNAALQDLNESANEEWEKACRGFLESTKADLGKMDESTASPNLLMAMGQSLIWISPCIRKPDSAPPSPSVVFTEKV